MRLSNILVNSSVLIGLVFLYRNIFLHSESGHPPAENNDQEATARAANPEVLDKDAYIRELAYQIWESEGWPEGESERHWNLAVQLSKMQEGDRE